MEMDEVSRLYSICRSSDNIDHVISMIDLRRSLFTANDKGNTLFHLCCTDNIDGPRILQCLLSVLPSFSVRQLFISNDDGNTPLHLACINGVTECVRLFLSHPPATIDIIFEFRNNSGLSPLYYASEAGHIDIVALVVSKPDQFSFDNVIKCICDGASWEIIRLLLMKITLKGLMDECKHTHHLLRRFPIDSEPFELSDGMTTALHLAAVSCDDLEYFTNFYTVSLGFDINRLDSEGYTPLHRAIEYGCISIAKYLISQSNCLCETFTKDTHTTPLHDAASELGDLSLVQCLVERDANVNAVDCNGSTPLHYSCSWGHLSIVRYFYQITSDTGARDSWGRSSIHLAAEFGHLHIVKYLVESCNDNVNVEDKYGHAPLYMAWFYNHLPVIEYLTAQPNCDISSINETHPLIAAADKKELEIVKLLIECGCDINVREKGTEFSPLHKACFNGSLSIVEYLISKPQCNIEAIDNEGNQPLHYAVCQGHKEIVSLLGKKVSEDGLSHCVKSAEPLAKPKIMKLLKELRRKLLKACMSNNVDIVDHLVTNRQCDVNTTWSDGWTLLHCACQLGHFEIVRFLISRTECNIEAENCNQDRPLHLACENGFVDIVSSLVNEKNCDINAKGWTGNTPLHLACDNGHFEIVKILTNHPLCKSIEAENDFNERPLNLAISGTSHMDIVNYLVAVKGCNTQGIKTYNTKIQRYLQIYQSSGIALLRVVKCILTGPPGAGKSTLKKRLLDQPLDIEPCFSTGIVDKAVPVSSFRKLSQHNAVATTKWKEQKLDGEAVLIAKKLLPADISSDESTGPNTPESNLSFEDTVDLALLPEGSKLEGIVESLTSSSIYIEPINAYHEESSSKADLATGKEENRVDTEMKNNRYSLSGVRGLSDYLRKIPVKMREKYEREFEEAKDNDHTILHIIDTGGQPEFHEILPALITGPAINLIVFKLTEDLRSRYDIIYRDPTGNSDPYKTSLTHEEVIFRSLASIACLRQNTIGWSFDEIPIEDNSEPVAFLIATHRDQVDENKVGQVNQQLRTKIESSSQLFDSDLVQFSQSEQVIFPLDATKEEEKEIEHLRYLLHNVISKKFQELEIPASWCIFSLKLRQYKKNIFKYNACFKLACECGIKNKKEFTNVLWYLHHRVGIIMHYPNVAGLKNIIITDLQLVYDRITDLIKSCFSFKQSGSAAVNKEFREKGLFSESQLDKIAKREKGNPLNTKRLVALLKHLYIVAGPMKTEVNYKIVNYYFMPCALKPADVGEEREVSTSISPLFICFECGYTPVGVFCCLVVYLLDQKADQVLKWKLVGNNNRNRITFKIGRYYDTVMLISRATYLEVWIQHVKGSIVSTSGLCDEILSSLHKGLDTVIQSLHYTYKSRHMFGVPCTACATSSMNHPAVIEFNEELAMCSISDNIMYIDKENLLWSKKIVMLNNKSQVSNSLHTLTTSTHHLSTIDDKTNRKRKQNEDDSKTGKRFKMFDNNRTTELVRNEQQKSDTSLYCEPAMHSDMQHKMIQDRLNHTLSIKDLDVVFGLLSNSFNRWKPLGLKLGINYITLCNIKSEEEKVQDRLMEMLAAWLKKKDKAVNPTWKKLIDSLKEIEENSLAEEIERKITSQ